MKRMRRFARRLRLRRWTACVVLAALLAAPSVDSVKVTPARDIAGERVFSLVQWHLTNALGKWAHRLRWMALGGKPSREEAILILDDYLQTSLQAEKEARRIQGLSGRSGEFTSKDAVSREALDALRAEQRALKPAAEEIVESELSSALRGQGFELWGGMVFPPVDIRFGKLPTLLVTSPRGRIARLERALLSPDLKYLERGRLEDAMLDEYNLSAYVGNLAGLSTYPTLVTDTDSLRSILRTAAHEWLHARWFFRPLGQAFWSSEEMATLNETAADIAGRELGDDVFVRMGGDLDDNPRRYLPQQDRYPRFTAMLRETRLRVEELLSQGKIDDAEAYMKERWWLLRLGGYGVRKLNQAYFALYGIYGENSTSVSPIGAQVAEYRGHFASVGEFIRAMGGLSSYEEFLAELRLRSGG